MSAAIQSAIGAAVGFAALEALDTVVKPLGYGSSMCPPLGATAVLLFCLAKAPASSPFAVLGGYIVSSLVALAVVTFLPPDFWFLAKGLAVSGAIGGMALTGTVHPPGGAYAFLFVAQKLPAQAIPPVLLGAAALIVAQKVVQAVVAATVGPEPKAKTK
ncbi:hypothetical protein EMIHUDRAFT_455417 [Emiliania huxleyi CCMP1516]|uniref:HPP transmembrane region domain-containing protein n=2 Tax=Emiliania huxleyi TaxID=2903 RepID=A0A0D3KGN9_EMIH1|nr:hypothetical protein EMIHUDRAFT_455417 [Emiliania huxleyi CCMP1516]EOD34924.1 hypothetical protein EMIHUDRAFT_455417 [Emiliania huxleyi CCMP1516]|eukprot:XP_005787353.1 hypothetical protein EMIHUDRAFT_455417 [Emiliania huxleyi CCMP1516]